MDKDEIKIINPEDEICKICGKRSTLTKIYCGVGRSVYYWDCKDRVKRKCVHGPMNLIRGPQTT
jgi:hypothetical protein